MILARSGDESPVAITIGGVYDSLTRAGNLVIRLVATDVVDGANLKLRIALTETHINYNAPNGTNIHNETFRDLIPTAAGTTVTINPGDTLYYNQAFTHSATVNFHNGQIVVWLQSDATKEIHQTAVKNLVQFPATGIDDDPTLPLAFNLTQNYPNPFNSKTMIDYSIATPGDVRLAVYDLAGRLVNTLYDGNQNAGHYQIVWNGQDLKGRQVASGIYFYRLEAESKSVTKRMVMLK